MITNRMGFLSAAAALKAASASCAHARSGPFGACPKAHRHPATSRREAARHEGRGMRSFSDAGRGGFPGRDSETHSNGGPRGIFRPRPRLPWARLAEKLHHFRAVAFVENLALKDCARAFPRPKLAGYELQARLGEGDVFAYPFGAV